MNANKISPNDNIYRQNIVRSDLADTPLKEYKLTSKIYWVDVCLQWFNSSVPLFTSRLSELLEQTLL